MRVLTKQEKEAFEIAYSFMDRVGCMAYETDNVTEVRVQTATTLDRLPPKVILFIGSIGGLEKANQFFNGYMKEKTFDRFVKKLMDNKEQPKDYWSEGVLTLDRIKVEERVYDDSRF